MGLNLGQANGALELPCVFLSLPFSRIQSREQAKIYAFAPPMQK